MIPNTVVLSHRLRVNSTYPYEEALQKAKAWLREKGITQVKPIYRTKL